MPIIRREASASSKDHKDIYFKRRTNPGKFDAYENLIVTWVVNSKNRQHTDFDVYSTLEDALHDRNPWKYFNGNDRDIGFPRDSSPRKFTGW